MYLFHQTSSHAGNYVHTTAEFTAEEDIYIANWTFTIKKSPGYGSMKNAIGPMVVWLGRLVSGQVGGGWVSR